MHTARALENFTASGTPVSVHPTLVAGLGAVKLAAVRANHELGLIDPRRANAIERACQDVRDGLLDDQFVVDVLQGGAGTSTNMNANEVIANRALELLGLPAGSYDEVHPLDHVNRSQSTNDVYPTALRLGLLAALDGLSDAVHVLAETCEAKSRQFWSVPKVGRTQLQDAVPMTVGQEFAAWAATLVEEQARILDSRAPAARDQPRGHRDRHRHHRGAGVSRGRVPPPRRDHRPASWSARPTWSRPPPTPACSCSCPGCSSAPP